MFISTVTCLGYSLNPDTSNLMSYRVASYCHLWIASVFGNQPFHDLPPHDRKRPDAVAEQHGVTAVSHVPEAECVEGSHQQDPVNGMQDIIGLGVFVINAQQIAQRVKQERRGQQSVADMGVGAPAAPAPDERNEDR